MESEIGPGLLTGFQEVEGRWTGYDVEWGADLDPSLFVPDVPPDYERIDVESLRNQAAAAGAGLLTVPVVALYALRRRNSRRT